MSRQDADVPRPPRGATRADRAERVRAQILESAIPLFARGFDSVAVQDVARAAGVKHSLVMYHFGTKEQLWEHAARLLMTRFDACHAAHLARLPAASDLRAEAERQLYAFILALRDLPAYGQTLLAEGVNPSPRLTWLHRNFFPKAFDVLALGDVRLEAALGQVTLLRTALSGALFYTVVAAPQSVASAEEQGGEAPSELYPMSDALAKRLAQMLASWVLRELGVG